MVTFDREVLRPSPLRRLGGFGRAAMGALVGLQASVYGLTARPEGWALLVAAVVLLLDGVHQATGELIITPDGARLRSLFTNRTLAWTSVAEARFSTDRIPRAFGLQTVVAFLGLLGGTALAVALVRDVKGVYVGVYLVATALACVTLLRVLLGLFGIEAGGAGPPAPQVTFLDPDGRTVLQVRLPVRMADALLLRRRLRELHVRTMSPAG